MEFVVKVFLKKTKNPKGGKEAELGAIQFSSKKLLKFVGKKVKVKVD